MGRGVWGLGGGGRGEGSEMKGAWQEGEIQGRSSGLLEWEEWLVLEICQ